MNRLMVSFILLLWMAGGSTVCRAQLLEDADTRQLLQMAIDKIYNFEFKAADPLISVIRNRYPQHPVVPLLTALKLSWQGMPLRKEKPVYAEYIKQLEVTVRQANTLLAKKPNDPEGVFFSLAGHSYLALQHSEEGQTMDAISEARKAYSFLKSGMKLTGTYADFYLSTGLYNYYVVQYPENHPAVRPFLIFFANGDKRQGLLQLETGANLGTFTKTESLYYLLHILVKHEMQFGKALACSTRLIKQFPDNLLFQMRHAEMLVLNERYREAEVYIQKILVQPDKIYQATAAVLRGMEEEKGNKDDAAARDWYTQALKLKAFDRRYTQDYYAMAYAGLARIAAREGSKEQARVYYKKVLELAEYESTIREAKNYLKNA